MFENLTYTRKTFVCISFCLLMFPSFVLFSFHIFTTIEGPNPFLIVTIIFGGILSIFLGLVIYLFADNKFERKLIIISLSIFYQFLILPVIWGIEQFKFNTFMSNHQIKLDFIATNILSKKWTLEEGQNYTKEQIQVIKLYQYIEEDKIVLFLIHGMIDNCYGIGFSETGNPPLTNRCGKLISWKKISKNWYIWKTT